MQPTECITPQDWHQASVEALLVSGKRQGGWGSAEALLLPGGRATASNIGGHTYALDPGLRKVLCVGAPDCGLPSTNRLALVGLCPWGASRPPFQRVSCPP